jgi:transcriptional regulator with XRE-family HTH domain
MPRMETRKVEIGSRLRECRLGARLSLGDVAHELRVTKQAISSWETGRTKLNAYQLADLVLIYGVSADYVLFGTHMVPETLRDAFSRAGRQ